MAVKERFPDPTVNALCMTSLRHHIVLNVCSLLILAGLLTASFHELSHFMQPMGDEEAHGTVGNPVANPDESVVLEHVDCPTCVLAASLSAVETVPTFVSSDEMRSSGLKLASQTPEELSAFAFDARGPPNSQG